MSSNFPFGFTPGDNEPTPQGGFDINQLGEMLQQIGAMMQQSSAAGLTGEGAAPVNWELATDTARKAIVAGGDPSVTDGQRSATETAVDLAEVWLDGVTDFPATGGRPAAWCRSEWFTATLPAWQGIIDPVAEKVQGSMSGLLPGAGGEGILPEGLPPELAQMMGPIMGMAKQMGATMFGVQVAQGLAGLASEVVSASDVGVPLTDDGRPALLPGNVKAFGEGLGVPERDTLLFLALRECAHQRLFAHVPWLRSRMQAAVEAYARGIDVDTGAIESALSGIDPSNPQAVQEVLASGVLVPEDTPEQRAALERLETLLALVEGWVDAVVTDAAAGRLTSVVQLQEAIRRRRAAGGPAERTFATLVGLELRPRKLREAAALWAELSSVRGQSGRDAVWTHPDLLPTAEDLEHPESFVAATDPAAAADLDAELGALGSGLDTPSAAEAAVEADDDTPAADDDKPE